MRRSLKDAEGLREERGVSFLPVPAVGGRKQSRWHERELVRAQNWAQSADSVAPSHPDPLCGTSWLSVACGKPLKL